MVHVLLINNSFSLVLLSIRLTLLWRISRLLVVNLTFLMSLALVHVLNSELDTAVVLAHLSVLITKSCFLH